MCYCGKIERFEDCCNRFISGNSIPETAEELMRARYSAYVTKNIDFIINTCYKQVKREEVEEWANSATWVSLDIHKVENGTKDDTDGVIHFTAKYKINNALKYHNEIAEFTKINGGWQFLDSIAQNSTITNQNKIGRNDPCSCGSGKKYKKCCGN